MRKKLFAALLFLFAAALFWKEIAGACLVAAVRVKTGWRLDYSELQYRQGEWTFVDLVLFDAASRDELTALRAKKAVLSFPLAFKLHELHLTLSEKMAEFLLFSDTVVCDFCVENGRLDWAGGKYPSSQLQFAKQRSGEISANFIRGSETLSVAAEPKEGAWSFLIKCNKLNVNGLHPFFQGGRVSGNANGELEAGWLRHLALDADVEGVSFEKQGCLVKGSGSIDGNLRNFAFAGSPLDWMNAIDRGRISVREGGVKRGLSELQKIDFFGSYQAGVGAKGEGRGISKEGLDLFCKAKCSLHPSRSAWGEAECLVGNASTRIFWDGNWRGEWRNIGPSEAALLQQLFDLFPDVSWKEGIASGEVFYSPNQELRIDQLEVDHLKIGWDRSGIEGGIETAQLKNGEGVLDGVWVQSRGEIPFCASGWSGAWRNEALQMQGAIDQIASRICCKKQGRMWNVDLFAADLLEANADISYSDGSIDIEKCSGEAKGISFEGAGKFFRNAENQWAYCAAMPYFSGVTKELFLFSAEIVSRGAGAYAEGLIGSGFQPAGWSLECEVKDANGPLHPLLWMRSGSFALSADSQGWDLSDFRAEAELRFGETSLLIPLDSPRLCKRNKTIQFDLRASKDSWDFIRISGEKTGSKIRFDKEKSTLFGAPILCNEWMWGEAGLVQGSLQSALSLALLKSVARWEEMEPLDGMLAIDASFDQNGESYLRLLGKEILWNGDPTELLVQIEKNTALFAMGPLRAEGKLSIDGSALKISDGRAQLGGATALFHGSINAELQGEFQITESSVDGKSADSIFQSWGLRPIELDGILEAKGNVSISAKRCDADLEMEAKNLQIQGFCVNQAAPFHLFASSEEGAILKGLDLSLAKGTSVLKAEVGICRIDAKRKHWILQKTHLHLPAELLALASVPGAKFFDPGHEVDLYAEIDCAFDFSEAVFAIKEGFLPLGGSMRHVRDLFLSAQDRQCRGSCLFFHQGKIVKLSAEAKWDDEVSGKCCFEDIEAEGLPPLAIDWSYGRGGLNIREIAGNFAGVDASFHAIECAEASRLIGTARVDFSRVADWAPPDVAKFFFESKMGKGYEFKGHLSIDRKKWSDIRFQGICSGKQIELFGFQLRTLLAQVAFAPDFLRVYDLKISDSAGVLKIDDLRMESKEQGPWTIEIPKISVAELRPSLLHGPGEEPGQLTPLLVRKMAITDWKGFANDPKSLTAKGTLSFINSFKRGETILDLPTNLFGRIIGLDLELLIPVVGELDFTLKDGYFTLDELKGAFSEGKRSQFFLAQSESPPRMDFDGNLQIAIQMKQFVLFKITEAFVISINGKLNAPEFKLQKRRRFLSIGS